MLPFRVISSMAAWLPWAMVVDEADGEPIASVIAMAGFVLGVLPTRWLMATGPLQLVGLATIAALVPPVRSLDVWLFHLFFALHALLSLGLFLQARRQERERAAASAVASTLPAEVSWVPHDCGGPDVED